MYAADERGWFYAESASRAVMMLWPSIKVSEFDVCALTDIIAPDTFL